MPILKMFIGKVLYDKVHVRHVEELSAVEMQKSYEHAAASLARKHASVINRAAIEPKFFVDRPSKMQEMIITDKELQAFEAFIVKRRNRHFLHIKPQHENVTCHLSAAANGL